MTITVEAILEQVRRLTPEEQARLRAALDEDALDRYPPLPLEIQRMLEGKTLADFVVEPQGTVEEARAWLQSLNVDDPEMDEEGGESRNDMLRSLDRNRFSTRRLFPELDQES
jgi:hypothetical protein